MSAPAQIDYDALAQKHGATIDYDALASKHGAISAPQTASAEPDHTQPESFWDTVYDRSGLGAIQKLSGSLADWAKRKATEKQTERLTAVAQGKPEPTNGLGADDYNLLSSGAKFISGAFQPKNLAISAGVAAANSNPITGIPMDAALVAHGGYGVLKNAPEALKGNPEAAQDALLSGAEMAGGGAGLGAKVNAVNSGAAAQRLYRSALKPSTTLAPEKATAQINEALKSGIPVSPGGYEKLLNLMDDVNTQIENKIKVGSRLGVTIDPNAVASRIAQTKGQFKNQVNASQDLATIDATKQQFLQEQGAKPATPGTPSQPTGLVDPYGKPIMSPAVPGNPATPAQPMDALKAQQMKVGTYQQLRKSYGQLSNASVEAQKALARGLKEELANTFPGLNELNAQDASLIGLQDSLERAIGRNENHQMLGIGTPLAAAGAKAVTGSSGLAAVTGILKAVVDDPIVKSKLAISLSKASRGAIPLDLATQRIAQYSAALGASAGAQPPANQESEQ